jgi:hypothetical protein
VPLAPLDGAVNITAIPLIGLPFASDTFACKGVANAVFVTVVCGVPVVALTADGVLGGKVPLAELVREKFAGVATPVTVAVTMYGPPAIPSAVNAGATATPCAFVVAVVVLPPPVNVPLAPLDGAVNIMAIPLIGLPFASVTVTSKGIANAVLMAALCGAPDVVVTEAGVLVMFVESVALAVAEPPPETLIWLSCGEVALFATFTITVIGG